MRKIEFRGKRVLGNDWIYGNYILDGKEHYIAINPKTANDDMGTGSWLVKEETVGQYTGLKDKNSVKIFEGDIIKLTTADYEDITITCEFGNARRQILENEVEITGFYFIRSDNNRKCFPITNNYLGKHDTEIWTVIGNIHDNPELLKEINND